MNYEVRYENKVRERINDGLWTELAPVLATELAPLDIKAHNTIEVLCRMDIEEELLCQAHDENFTNETE